MQYTEEDLKLYANYMDYIRLVEGIDEIEWIKNKDWTIITSDGNKKVVSFRQWLTMSKREEKLNELFSQVNR